jgi:hypothetical protein
MRLSAFMKATVTAAVLAVATFVLPKSERGAEENTSL